MPLCYSGDEAVGVSPTKSDYGSSLSGSSTNTDTTDDSSENLLYFKVPDLRLNGKKNSLLTLSISISHLHSFINHFIFHYISILNKITVNCEQLYNWWLLICAPN